MLFPQLQGVSLRAKSLSGLEPRPVRATAVLYLNKFVWKPIEEADSDRHVKGAMALMSTRP